MISTQNSRYLRYLATSQSGKNCQEVANSGSSICTMNPASVIALYSSRTTSATAVMYSSSEE